MSNDTLSRFQFAPTDQAQPWKPFPRAKWLVASLYERWSNSSICSRCRKILRQASTILVQPSRFLYFYQGLEHLWEESRGGCQLCLILTGALSEIKKSVMRLKVHSHAVSESRGEKLEEIIDWRVAAFAWGDNGAQEISLSVDYRVNYHEDFEPHNSSHFLLINVSDTYFNNFARQLSYLETSTNSSNTAMQIKKWLDCCTKHHSRCSPKNRASINTSIPLPTRLVEINSIFPLQARICESRTLDPSTKYFTLSHCWGTAIPYRLLKKSLGSMMESIAVEDLSTTFRHALEVTFTMGFKYIWIDALCIIQDSEDDWGRESGMMSTIYSNTYCNISAAVSVNGTGGLFRQRDTQALQPCRVRLGGLSYYLVDRGLWMREVEESPLQKRAWVCQERVLAPRNLHYTSTQVFWECSEVCASESFPFGLPSSITTLSSLRLSHPLAGNMSIKDLGDMNGLRKYDIWNMIVELYSSRALTKDTDKLIAIGGIAAKLESVLNDTFIAGLWRSDLINGLMWKCQDSNSSSYSQFVAPSWSWASVNSRVTWHRDAWNLVSTHQLEVLNAHVDYLTRNRFGQLRGGSLSIRGRLFQTVIRSKEGRFSRYLVNIRCLPLVGGEMWIYLDATLMDGRMASVINDELYCMLAREKTERPLPGIDGLLLKPTGNTNEFRRIGMFQVYESTAWTRDGMRYFDSKAAESGLEYSDDGEGGYKYTITIV